MLWLANIIISARKHKLLRAHIRWQYPHPSAHMSCQQAQIHCHRLANIGRGLILSANDHSPPLEPAHFVHYAALGIVPGRCKLLELLSLAVETLHKTCSLWRVRPFPTLAAHVDEDDEKRATEPIVTTGFVIFAPHVSRNGCWRALGI